jgi:hypothetical protein
LAFHELSSLRIHFSPFTCSFRKFFAVLQQSLGIVKDRSVKGLKLRDR